MRNNLNGFSSLLALALFPKHNLHAREMFHRDGERSFLPKRILLLT